MKSTTVIPLLLLTAFLHGSAFAEEAPREPASAPVDPEAAERGALELPDVFPINMGFNNRPPIDLSKVSKQPSSKIGLYSSPIPPRVIMGFASIPDLAGVPLEEWTYVRENLYGLWTNMAGTGEADFRKLASAIKSKRYWLICPVNNAKYDEDGNLLEVKFSVRLRDELKAGLDRPKIVLVNDYVTKSGKDPQRYYSEGFIDKAIEHITREITPGENPFGRRFYITTRAGHFRAAAYDMPSGPIEPNTIPGRAFSTMVDVSEEGGFVYEANPLQILTDHREGYIKAFNRARELGADFLWLCPRGHEGTPADYSDALVDAYKWMEKNEVFPDGIVLIHYSRTAASGDIDYLEMLPMINPDDPSLPAPGSFTGAMYWALKQREIALGKN